MRVGCDLALRTPATAGWRGGTSLVPCPSPVAPVVRVCAPSRTSQGELQLPRQAATLVGDVLAGLRGSPGPLPHVAPRGGGCHAGASLFVKAVKWYHPEPWPHARSQVGESISGSAGGPARTHNSKSSYRQRAGALLCIQLWCIGETRVRPALPSLRANPPGCWP